MNEPTPDSPTDASTLTDESEEAARLLDLLTNPDAFFRRLVPSPSFRGPILVVLLVALIAIAGSLPVTRATTGALPEGAGPVGSLVLVFSVIGGFIGVLVTWFLYAAAFHVVSALAFGAEGSFRTTLALTGWGLVPRIPQGLISAGITYVVFADATMPTDPVAAGRMAQMLQNDPLFTLATWLGVVFLLWSAMLWTFGMRHGRDLTLKQAGLTVGIPVGLRLVLLILGEVGVFSGLFGFPT